MNNPMDLIKAIKDPRQFVLSQIDINDNPMLKNLVEMAEKGDREGIETFAKNIFKENGRNFEKEYSELMKLFQK